MRPAPWVFADRPRSSAPPRMTEETCAGVKAGLAERTSAARPAPIGEEKEVPVAGAVLPERSVVSTASPGATRPLEASCEPRDEKLVTEPLVLVAPMGMTPVQLPGLFTDEPSL